MDTVPSGCAFLFDIHVVDGVSGVKVWTVLSQHFLKDNVTLEAVDVLVRVALNEDPVQTGVGVQIDDEVQAVLLNSKQRKDMSGWLLSFSEYGSSCASSVRKK